MARLFSPLELRSKELPNRIIVSPMCQYSATDGNANTWHEIHLGNLALSGAGLLFTEATSVTAGGRITPGDLGLYCQDNEKALEKVVAGIRANSDILLGMQLGHAGRKGSSRAPWDGGALIKVEEGGWKPLAPSAIPHLGHEEAPLAMTHDDIEEISGAFVQTAKRAIDLGFDVLELHCAHGYLLHEFLSPVSNKRTDRYGGSLENRMRFPLEVFTAVREAIPERRPLGVRISATDWLEHTGEDSWRLEDSIAFARKLEELGCDFIDVSSGGISPLQKIDIGPGYQVRFAEAVKQEVKMPVFTVGMITEPGQAEAIIANGQADCVALARAMLFDPRWPWRAAKELGGTVSGPKQYSRSLPAGSGRIFGDIKVGQR